MAGSTIGGSDGAWSYPRCREALDSLGRQLDASVPAREEPLAVAADQSLAGALLLLALLESGRGFVVERPGASTRLPEPGGRARVGARVRPEGGGLALDVQETGGVGEEPAPRGVLFSTSGSGGEPKLVLHRHETLVANAGNCIGRLGLDATSRVAIPVPLHHLYGLGAAFLPAVLAGASIDLVPRADLLRIVEREKAFDPDTVFLTPTLADGLARGRRTPRPYALSITAGDVLREEVAAAYERLFGPLVQIYGSTELGAIAVGTPSDPPGIRHRWAGAPLPGVALRLEATPRGPLSCRHPFGFSGYVSSAGGFEPAPAWLATRDLAELDPEGRVRLLGRLDDCVNRDGVLVALAPVEEALGRIEGIAAAAAVPGREGRRGRTIVAFCQPHPAARLDPDRIRRGLVAVLERRAIPDRVEMLDVLPLLPSGKVDRRTLRRWALDGSERG